DAIVTEADCKTKDSITIERETASGVIRDFAEAVFGRFTAEAVVDSNGNEIAAKGEFLTKELSRAVAASDAPFVKARSPMTCTAHHGICQKCYGADLTTHQPIDLGEAVGTIAAQAIGEPGTQLTMRTFHAGGAATVGG